LVGARREERHPCRSRRPTGRRIRCEYALPVFFLVDLLFVLLVRVFAVGAVRVRRSAVCFGGQGIYPVW
jgi:hypothetical protein